MFWSVVVRVVLAVALTVLLWPAASSGQQVPGAVAQPASEFNPVLENLRRNLPDNPVVSTAPGPVVTEDMTREEFLEAIEPVATFDWSQVEWDPAASKSSGRPPATAVSPDDVADELDKLREDLEDGEVALNAALPGPGTSLLGVPHSQTIAYGETSAQKFVANGDLQIATCYYDMYASTPNATRHIKYGIAWSCNVPWIRGYIASGIGEPIYNPQGVRNLNEFSGNVDISPGWYNHRNYIAEGDYVREREDQQIIQYGYLVLAVDGRAGQDGFLTEPGGAGHTTRDCTGGSLQLTVTCQFIAGPYLWVPTDNTQCGTGVCDVGPYVNELNCLAEGSSTPGEICTTANAYGTTSDSEGPDTPGISDVPLPSKPAELESDCNLYVSEQGTASNCFGPGAQVRGRLPWLPDYECGIAARSTWRDPPRGKLGPYIVRGTVKHECDGDLDDIEKLAVSACVERLTRGGWIVEACPYTERTSDDDKEKFIFRFWVPCRVPGIYRVHATGTIYDQDSASYDGLGKTSQRSVGPESHYIRC